MHMRFSHRTRISPAFGWLLAISLTLPVAPAALALAELDEADLGEVTGEGLSFPFDNIRFQMAKSSFIELTGSAPTGGTTFQRGDVRYYGLAMSRGANSSGVIDNSAGMDWIGNGCTGGFYGLGCPMSSYGIQNYSTVDNPYVLRVFDYDRMGTGGTNTIRTVMEFMGPSNTDPFRWAFWGEIESGRVVNAATGATTTPGTVLKSQSIILGKPTSRLKPPSLYGVADSGASANPNQGNVLRMMQFQGDQSLGLTYSSRLSGDFRFSVNTTAVAGTVAAGAVPDFTDEEGLYFRNVSAFLPLGQLHYQALTLNDTQTGNGGVTNNGNFVIELAPIPSAPNIFNEFYSLPTTGSGATKGYNRAISNVNANYFNTHGYVEWGDKFPICSGTNCMSGSGVSNQRFSGAGDGPTPTTLTLPALANNGTNFSGDLCTNAFGGWTGCTSWTAGTAAAVNVNIDNSQQVMATGTRADIVGSGGIVFVARSGSSWSVLNNQNLPQASRSLSVATLQNDLEVKRARTNETSCNVFGASCDVLVVDSTPDIATIQNRANALYAYPANYNPMVTMDAINLGSARIEGFLINHLKITSLGAN